MSTQDVTLYAHGKVDGQWINTPKGYVKVNGVWKPIRYMFVKKNGIWEQACDINPPIGYKPLAYLKSTGATQYIDTGKSYSLPQKWEIQFRNLTRNATTSGPFGSTGWLYSLCTYSNNSLRWLPSGSYMYNRACTYTAINTCICNKGGNFSVNGVNGSGGSDSGNTGGGNTWLFTGASHKKTQVEIMYYKAYDASGNLIQWLEPFMRESDGVVGMWDKIGRTFLTNAGTGNFDYSEVL